MVLSFSILAIILVSLTTPGLIAQAVSERRQKTVQQEAA